MSKLTLSHKDLRCGVMRSVSLPDASVPVSLPGSFPPRVPQPYGYNPSPLQPAADYYVTRKEVKKLLESLDMTNVMQRVPSAAPGTVPVFGSGGELTATSVKLSDMTEAQESHARSIADMEGVLALVRETLSSDAAAIAKIMEILTSRDEASRASALGVKEMLESMPDPDLMTQAEKTDFILKLVEYALTKEDLL